MIDGWFLIFAGFVAVVLALYQSFAHDRTNAKYDGWLSVIVFLLALILAALVGIQLQLGELILEIN